MSANYFSGGNSVTVKLVVIAVMALLLLIPANMMESLISDRIANKKNVELEMSQKWGGKQHVAGINLVLPYEKFDAKGKALGVDYAYFSPELLTINADLVPEERSRGIYNVLCYQAQMKLKGKFNFPDYAALGLTKEQIYWNDAYVVLGVSSVKDIKGKVGLTMNGVPQEMFMNVADKKRTRSEYELMEEGSVAEQKITIGTGLRSKVKLDNVKMQDGCTFDYNFSLNGIKNIYFSANGKQTDIQVKSTWKSVSFDGSSFPNVRDVTDKGFDASWQLFGYNFNNPQMWLGVDSTQTSDSTVEVNLLQPIDHYQKTMRLAKYALLFISLTFLIFFIIEILSRKPIHPVQYLLVSFALLLFYSLLLSLSEHMGFLLSYIVSAAATVFLVTAYCRSIFKNIKQALILGGFLSALYAFLYIVLQQENLALLLGSIGLFVTLASVMYASRKVDWYRKDKNDGEEIS